MHAETGLLAVVRSVCMLLALVLAWCLAGVRSSGFGAVMALSFTVTTVGYGGAAWYVAHAIVHAAH